LLLDATVVRMFLVPSVMKLLGDDCWWAPRWARRLQNRIGLGEIDLPDERRRPTINGRPARPPVSAGALVAAAPRAPHDPTHPGALEPARPRPPGPARPDGDAETTRLPASDKNAGAAPGNHNPPVPQRSADHRGPGQPAPPRPPSPPAPPPSGGQTRAMAVPTNDKADPADGADPAEPTKALPITRPEAKDSETATEKLNARGQGLGHPDGSDNARQRRRIGGALSAQDLLRREGRL